MALNTGRVTLIRLVVLNGTNLLADVFGCTVVASGTEVSTLFRDGRGNHRSTSADIASTALNLTVGSDTS